jgi:hypothetical protein
MLIGLAIIFLLLFLVKDLYLNLPHDLFFSAPGKALRTFIDSLLGDWVVLHMLWRAIPPWQPRPTTSTPSWEYLYVMWGAGGVAVLGGFLRWRAHTRRAEIMEYTREIQREAWREQARRARRRAPDDRGSTRANRPDPWHEYAAPPAPWSQTVGGILVLGLITALVGGLVVGVILLYAEYAFFQVLWPSGRN